MTAALRAADLAPSGWLKPGDLAVILRSAYDPVVAGALERHGDLGRDLATAGPVAVSETWASVRSDSAHHCVLWISEWPRSLVYPGFLAPVLLSSGVRRTFTLLFTPMRTDQAARIIRNGPVHYVANLIQAPLIIVFGSAAAQPTERGTAMFDAMLSRSAAAIEARHSPSEIAPVIAGSSRSSANAAAS